MVVLIDNYDSFVHNLARYLRRLGQETLVVRNDAMSPAEIEQLSPAAIVLSPGPCTPNEAGCSLELVRRLACRVPILGVCLGHQTIAAALGATIIRSPVPMHGRSSLIRHNGDGLFAGVPNPLRVGRYHSLVVDARTLPDELCVTARTDDNLIMALAHRDGPLYGVQFHPESILTERGYTLLANFLRLARIDASQLADPQHLAEQVPRPEEPAALPLGPVTF